MGKDGLPRILEESGTYIAKYRDGSGDIREVSTGCREEDAARSVLSKLERRAELVKSKVMSSAEMSSADHQTTPLADHFAEYLNHLRARETSPVRVANMKSQFERVSGDCFRRLADLDGCKLTKWLLERESEEMSAATRNGYGKLLSCLRTGAAPDQGQDCRSIRSPVFPKRTSKQTAVDTVGR